LTRSYLNKKRAQGPMPVVVPIFEMIATAKVAKSAYEAQDMLYLRETDIITMNRDRLLADAKKRALEMASHYKAPLSADIVLPGPTAKVAMEMAVGDFHKKGVATDYDVVVAEKLSIILSGGATDITETITEDQLLALEREAFMPLVQDPRTLARIQQMLETGKPLRN
ncbi:MAG: 3-hydroxyacyl-CoA dehydrogenase, partial [Alphaproteobacteria bacterium]|nr:3-hydroxyacyl-CoA dehydrogenase [Alphaproteobacteria bacterium]